MSKSGLTQIIPEAFSFSEIKSTWTSFHENNAVWQKFPQGFHILQVLQGYQTSHPQPSYKAAYSVNNGKASIISLEYRFIAGEFVPQSVFVEQIIKENKHIFYRLNFSQKRGIIKIYEQQHELIANNKQVIVAPFSSSSISSVLLFIWIGEWKNAQNRSKKFQIRECLVKLFIPSIDIFITSQCDQYSLWACWARSIFRIFLGRRGYMQIFISLPIGLQITDLPRANESKISATRPSCCHN